MKNWIEQVGQNHGQKEFAHLEPAGGFFYKVSKKPKSKHKKLFSPKGSSLITPSGARVPPAWTDLWMTTDPKSHIQAVGRDSKGRRVYLYSAEHTGRAAAAKFSRLKEFARVYPFLIKKVERDMKTREEALVLYLISKTGFRIGSNSETLAAVKAFGASTLRCSHISVEGNKISFDFIGKKGIRVVKVLKDAFLASKITARCDGLTDQQIFRITDDEIRTYLYSIQKSSRFTVKDFRTYLGTLTAFRKIKTMPVPKNGAEFKRSRKEVGEAVARELGNSSNIALKAYVSPEVFCEWQFSSAAAFKPSLQKSSVQANEFFDCVHYDQKVPPEEWKDSDPLEKLE